MEDIKINEDRVPKALFNSKALFNPYQYEPFSKILKWNTEKGQFSWNGRNLLITDEVGVGKTFEVGIILSEFLRNEPDYTVLIVCPSKLCSNWENELYDKFYVPCKNYYKEKDFGQITVVPYSYFEKDNIEYPQYDILVLDEAHFIRNEGGTRLNNITCMINENEITKDEKLKIFMTATPIFNRDNDLKQLFNLLGENYEVTKTLQSEANCYNEILKIFLWGEDEGRYSKNKLIKTNTEEQNIINEIYSGKYSNITGYLKRIASSSFYALKEFIESKEERKNIVKDINEIENREDYSQDDIDYSELKVLTDEWKGKEDSKIKALNKLLERLKNREEEGNKQFKAIIFSHFLITVDYLKDKLGEQYITYNLKGEMSTSKANEIIKAFEKERSPAVLICSDAFKEGQNLQFCHYLIHYDLPFTPAEIGQRNGRIYRKGQEGTPEIYYLILECGYDLRIFGEIIVEKCRVIERSISEGKLSAINVMPWDAEDYIKKIVGNYIDDYFEEKKDNKDEKGIIKQFLEEYFAKKEENGQLQWLNKGAEELYNNEEKNKDSLKELYVSNILIPRSEESEDNKIISGLSKIYEEKYNEKVNDFVKGYMPIDGDSALKAETLFEDACNKYLNKYLKEEASKYKFCHNAISENDFEEFIPLERIMEEV